jgi:hypothetical protein
MSLKLSEEVTPSPEVLNEIKQAYNRVLKRRSEAEKFLDNPGISNGKKERHLVTFRIEIVNVLEEYLQVLKDWGVEATSEEIMNGFTVNGG